MITVSNESDATAAKNYMTATFHLDDGHHIVIDEVIMTKKFNNRMSKEKQRAVRAYLKEHAGHQFDVKDGTKIELVFHADKSKVEVTFKQAQPKG